MPLKYKINCSVCQRSKGNPKLRARIYAAYYKQDEGDERLAHIAREQGMNLQPLYNHCKKHISPNPEITPIRVEGHIEKLKAQIAKETELAIDHDAALPKEDYERALTDVIAEGMAELRKGGKTVTVSQLIAAAKIKGDFQAKKRGQDVEIIKTMYKFSSGDKVKTDEQG